MHILTKSWKYFSKVFIRYLIPSALYCLYNNLIFVNLKAYDPTTYFMLLQFRVVVTGVLFQILFSKRLTFLQWTSLFLLTIGCMIKYIDFTNLNKDLSSPKTNYESYLFNKNFLFVMLQVFSSCFAGVYNEYLIKKYKKKMEFVYYKLEKIF